MFDRGAYHKFIAAKGARADTTGFSPVGLPPRLFAHQKTATEFALERGRAALFLDTGLGKSGCEAVFASEAARETGKPALILTPLAVARQMQRECEAFGIDAKVIREASDMDGAPPVVIANYERLQKLDPAMFGGVVLDESSILKSFTGSTKRALVEAFRDTPYRLAATATPAPNDHMELGQHSEFLGIMGSMEMLCRWFINDTTTASQEWRLKKHGVSDFWAWVSSWARAASLPSDIGGEDSGFVLPPLRVHPHVVGVDLLEGAGEMMFRLPDSSATSIHAEKKKTLSERVSRATKIANEHDGHVIVWCERDDESAALTAAIDGAVEIKGSMPLDKKEAALDAFARAETRVMVSKPKLAGFVYHARAVIWKDPVVEMQRTKALGLLYKQLKKDSAMSRVGMPDYMLFFRKDEPNPEPITHTPDDLPVHQWQELASPVWMTVQQGNVLNGRMARGDDDQRHVCPLQLDVIERCLTLYSNPGDLVLDPFNGIGSTGFQALQMNRKYLGIELKPEYATQAAKFLTEAEGSAGTMLEVS